MKVGEKLRRRRQQLGLTLRDISAHSALIAQKHGNSDFEFPFARVSEMETKDDFFPSIHRLYTVATIYRLEPCELLGWFGIDTGSAAGDAGLYGTPKTRTLERLELPAKVKLPAGLTGEFDRTNTCLFQRIVRDWTLVPLTLFPQFSGAHYSIGYIGTRDNSMFPVIRPASFVIVDTLRTKVCDGEWRNEFERPVYFVELRNAFRCCWCSVSSKNLVLQSHPMSGEPTQTVAFSRDAEILGEVVAVSSRLRPEATLT